mmetsp:Transcript_78486/g.143526  ORF Transcript_78486/g.143526 Transcript_78486/m.143526 type:complete len:497 (-) Transcript_78486:139-1629(-)
MSASSSTIGLKNLPQSAMTEILAIDDAGDKMAMPQTWPSLTPDQTNLVKQMRVERRRLRSAADNCQKRGDDTGKQLALTLHNKLACFAMRMHATITDARVKAVEWKLDVGIAKIQEGVAECMVAKGCLHHIGSTRSIVEGAPEETTAQQALDVVPDHAKPVEAALDVAEADNEEAYEDRDEVQAAQIAADNAGKDRDEAQAAQIEAVHAEKDRDEAHAAQIAADKADKDRDEAKAAQIEADNAEKDRIDLFAPELIAEDTAAINTAEADGSSTPEAANAVRDDRIAAENAEDADVEQEKDDSDDDSDSSSSSMEEDLSLAAAPADTRSLSGPMARKKSPPHSDDDDGLQAEQDVVVTNAGVKGLVEEEREKRAKRLSSTGGAEMVESPAKVRRIVDGMIEADDVFEEFKMTKAYLEEGRGGRAALLYKMSCQVHSVSKGMVRCSRMLQTGVSSSDRNAWETSYVKHALHLKAMTKYVADRCIQVTAAVMQSLTVLT